MQSRKYNFFRCFRFSLFCKTKAIFVVNYSVLGFNSEKCELEILSVPVDKGEKSCNLLSVIIFEEAVLGCGVAGIESASAKGAVCVVLRYNEINGATYAENCGCVGCGERIGKALDRKSVV